jgi:hypothetical protein
VISLPKHVKHRAELLRMVIQPSMQYIGTCGGPAISDSRLS